MPNAAAFFGLLLATTVTVSVQQPPDFSGTWSATKDVPPTVALAPSAVFGDQFAMRQDAKNLTLVRPVRGRATAVATVLPLDGSETRVMSLSRPCFGQSGQLITLGWVGEALRYTIAGTIPPGGMTPTRSSFGYTFRKLSADTIVIETTMRGPSGPDPIAVGTVYRRSAVSVSAERR